MILQLSANQSQAWATSPLQSATDLCEVVREQEFENLAAKKLYKQENRESEVRADIEKGYIS